VVVDDLDVVGVASGTIAVERLVAYLDGLVPVVAST